MSALWSSSDWSRPLSPTRTSRYSRSARAQREHQHHQALESPEAPAAGEEGSPSHAATTPTTPSTVLHPPPHPPRLVARQEVLKALAAAEALQGSAEASAPSPAAASPQRSKDSVKLAIHYVGLARGELGVLTKRQVVQPRPSTAPAKSFSAIKCPWSPTYTLQAGSVGPPPIPPAGAHDIKHVVDDPVGRHHVNHDLFASKALRPVSPPQSPRGAVRSPRWMRAPPADARPATRELTTYSKPRLLSAGGFSGWKLSQSHHSPATVAKPTIPPSLRSPHSSEGLRPRTGAAPLHAVTEQSSHEDHFPPPPPSGPDPTITS